MELDDSAIWQLFIQSLYADILEEEQFFVRKPLLAHYTSLGSLEKILLTDEVWFSNPLFMNDLEEVRFGILNGATRLMQNVALYQALGTPARRDIFRASLDEAMNVYGKEHLLDTYVFCLSEHDPANRDGQLSMWRGYGGNGKGAAIVFDTSKLGQLPNSPLILAKVQYGSTDQRFAWIDKMAATVAEVIGKSAIPDDKLYLASGAAFERIKLFALFTKHGGFSEEREWRVVYQLERDAEKRLAPMFGYLHGDQGVEPKLKFKVVPVPGFTADDLSLEKIVSAILLGPSTSSELAKRSVERMLELIGKSTLKDRIVASTIPFRAL